MVKYDGDDNDDGNDDGCTAECMRGEQEDFTQRSTTKTMIMTITE